LVNILTVQVMFSFILKSKEVFGYCEIFLLCCVLFKILLYCWCVFSVAFWVFMYLVIAVWVIGWIFRLVGKTAKSAHELRHVPPSVCLEQLGCHRRISVEKTPVSLKMKGRTGTLDKEQCIFFIISRTFLLSMRNISGKSCRGNQNTHFNVNNIFPKIVSFIRECRNILCCRAGHRWQNGAHQLHAK
jgi:hypothetical protein